MPKKLKNLLIDRVDLVRRGDNPEAHIALFKRKPEGGDDTTETTLSKFVDRVVEAISTKKGVDTVPQPFSLKKWLGELKDEESKPLIDRMKTLDEDYQKAVSEAMGKLEEEQRSILALNYEIDKQEMKAELDTLKQEDEDEDDEEEEEEEEVANSAKSIPEEVMKSLPEEVQTMLKAQQSEAKKALELAEDLRKEKLEKEYTDIAKQYPNVVGTPDAFGKVLKRVADNSAEDFAVIDAVLKAAEERITRNDLLMKEFGAARGETAGDAWTRIDAKAQKLLESDSNGMTKEQAVAKIMRDEPELYKQYQKELMQEVN